MIMCSRVSRISLSQGQEVGSLGANCRRNSPVYACPVRHCTVLPKISRSSSSLRKRRVVFSVGWMRLDMAYLPCIERLFHSRSHGLSGAFLALLMALLRVTPMGAVLASLVASLASSSAFSFPVISWWAGNSPSLLYGCPIGEVLFTYK